MSNQSLGWSDIMSDHVKQNYNSHCILHYFAMLDSVGASQVVGMAIAVCSSRILVATPPRDPDMDEAPLSTVL